MPKDQTSRHLAFRFRGYSPSGKTERWLVTTHNLPTVVTLGEIYWYSGWRRYIFTPESGRIFDSDCLNRISAFLDQRFGKHRHELVRVGK